MKTSTILSLVLAASLTGPVTAYAQTAEPAAPYHHYQSHRYQGPHHTVHHHFVAHNPAPVVASPPPAQAAPFGLALPHIAPYPNNKGDEDGLSTDVNDCNKGCIGGAPD